MYYSTLSRTRAGEGHVHTRPGHGGRRRGSEREAAGPGGGVRAVHDAAGRAAAHGAIGPGGRGEGMRREGREGRGGPGERSTTVPAVVRRAVNDAAGGTATHSATGPGGRGVGEGEGGEGGEGRGGREGDVNRGVGGGPPCSAVFAMPMGAPQPHGDTRPGTQSAVAPCV